MVGNKATGLQFLPCSWTPPFIVITTLAYKRWKNDRESGETTQATAAHWLVTETRLADYVSTLCTGLTKSLIVRSSAPLETLRDRGRYESKCCNGTPEAIFAAASHVWTQAETVTPTSERAASGEMALVVQAYVRTLASGHLSNERRVSRRITEWVCEFDLPTKKKPTTVLRFTIKKIGGQLTQQDDLSCETEEQLKKKIRTVAAITSNLGQRCHYEWVWDGHKLWVVQRDTEDDYRGLHPTSRGIVRVTDVKPPSLVAFVEEPNTTGTWQKIKCVRTFRACGLPVARIFVLEDPNILKQLINGKVSKNLRFDLSWLLQLPIVVRSDVKKSTDLLPILLPRTDTLHDSNDAMDFMLRTATEFRQNGLKPDDFCFITHRFIHARSCAFSLSWPGISRVRIDSTWGLPDGLLFYPHDSFEVDSQNPQYMKRRIRCKTEYLDIDESGKWVEKRCGRPWDWKTSLESAELQEIARFSCKVSEYLKRPVQIMYFVDVDPASGHPPCLPWYYTTEGMAKLPQESSENRLAGKRIVISNEWDLLRLEKSIQVGVVSGTINILLKPRPELLRSRDFITKLARIALNNNFLVELEGSVLSHIYYMLSRQGVRVKCIDAFEPKLKRRRFGKLVRDLIPVYIKSRGETVQIYKLTEGELLPLLKAKAVEEALELYWESDPAKVFEELADLLEVIESICRLFGRNFDNLRSVTETKRKERGGFKDGVVLVETREVPLIGREPRQVSFLDMNESGEAIKISRFATKSVRKPIVRGKNIVIPLIPPDPTECSGQIIIPLGDSDQEAVITYTKKEVFVITRPIIRRRTDTKQLLLFPIGQG